MTGHSNLIIILTMTSFMFVMALIILLLAYTKEREVPFEKLKHLLVAVLVLGLIAVVCRTTLHINYYKKQEDRVAFLLKGYEDSYTYELSEQFLIYPYSKVTVKKSSLTEEEAEIISEALEFVYVTDVIVVNEENKETAGKDYEGVQLYNKSVSKEAEKLKPLAQDFDIIKNLLTNLDDLQAAVDSEILKKSKSVLDITITLDHKDTLLKEYKSLLLELNDKQQTRIGSTLTISIPSDGVYMWDYDNGTFMLVYRYD